MICDFQLLRQQEDGEREERIIKDYGEKKERWMSERKKKLNEWRK